MANRIPFIIALLLFLACWAPSTARGYGVETENSLEWNLADADRVVRGRVISIRYEQRDENETYANIGFADNLWRVYTVRVSETLKGPPADQLIVAEPHGGDERPLTVEPFDHLFCLVAGDRMFDADRPKSKDFFPWVACNNFNGQDYVLNLDAIAERPGPQYRPHLAVTADMRVLVGREEVLEVARRYCAVLPEQRPQPFTFQAFIPGDAQGLARLPFQLTVPLDAWTENLAHQQAASRDGVRRRNAITFLAQFQNPQNVAILQSMLNDPATTRVDFDHTWPYRRANKPVTSLFYMVRDAAAQTLNEWDIQTPANILEIPQADYARIRAQDFWRIVAGVPLGGVAIVLLSRLLVKRRRVAIVSLALGAPFWAALMLLTERSTYWADELMVTRGGRYRLLSYDHCLRFTRINGWPVPQEPLLGSFKFDTPSTKLLADPYSQPVIAWTQLDSPRGIHQWRGHAWGPDTLGEEVGLFRTGSITWQWHGLTTLRGTTADPTNASRRYVTYIVPNVWLIAPAAAASLIALIACMHRLGHFARQSLRRRRGLCPACGYDLRETPSLCPECGVPRTTYHPHLRAAGSTPQS